jgi:hypothetical protein
MPATRFTTRYGSPPARLCTTEGCTRQASNIAYLCHRCVNHLRRFGHPLQDLPDTYSLDAAIRRMEEQRARLRALDIAALEARWTTLVDDCRGRAEPSFKAHKRLSYNKWDAEASVTIRDLAESLSFNRALDLLAAMHLLNIERPHAFRSEESFACCVVEQFRRAGNVGRGWARVLPGETRQHSYRKELSRPTRLATASYLNVGLGAAALALAKREAKREAQAKATQADYYAVVRALAQADQS